MRLEPFKARKFNPDTYVIEGRGSVSYLLLGKEKALLIDTGFRKENLREFVETLTELPVQVINTHGHCDHIMGNPYFSEVFAIEAAVPDMTAYYKTMRSAGIEGNYEFTLVPDGHRFELGNRSVEIMAIPCHSPGDIALFDHKDRLLFTGDNLEIGQILIYYGTADTGATVEGHLEILERLRAHADEFDLICPAHNGTPIDKSYLTAAVENDRRILSGIEGSAEIHSPSFRAETFNNIDYEHVRCSLYQGVSIVYDTRRIFKKDSKGLFLV